MMNNERVSASAYPVKAMTRRPVIGVMGGGEVSDHHISAAYELGRLVAEQGWVLLNGGRGAGIMDSSARGAKEAGGLTVGILPGSERGQASAYVDVQIVTGMGSARNNINVLSSDVVIACSGGAGTLSEIALALKAKRPIIVLDFELGEAFSKYVETDQITVCRIPSEAIEIVRELLCKKESLSTR